MQKLLQQEWQFLQRVTDRFGEEFDNIRRALDDKFLPALFGTESVSNAKRQLACLPVKHSGLALPNPAAVAELSWKASTLACRQLVAALCERADFRLADHVTAQGCEGKPKCKNAKTQSRSLRTVHGDCFGYRACRKKQGSLTRNGDRCMALCSAFHSQ